ncbi:MAG: outer membrane protein insertion porin family [Sulfurimonas sp.]|jgi:outer membrane protein insertion porin family|uniref:outer membrane protein assembly factor BamA n=1 Tax=Sulfurimonas sp. TaxID=2022749 RepID=UPI0039E6D348
MKLSLFFLLTILTISANAMTVTSIKYKGMVHISNSVALRMLPFEVGEDIDSKVADAALQKYFKQGYFTDAWVDFNNGEVTFNFVEKPVISKIVLEGWKETEEEEILNTVIQIKKGSLYNEKKIEAAKKRIVQAISQDGKIDSVIEIEKEILDNGSLKITFIVNEGETIVIEKLQYDGVENLDSDDFNDVIANKEHEFMGWLFGRNDGEMKLGDLQYDNLRVRDYYMQNGYLDSKVGVPFVRVNFDSYTADMSYQVEEGEVYTINSVSINQATHVIDDAKIEEIITLENNEVFNIKTFRENAELIKTLIADHSYAFVQVIPDLKKNKKEKTVDVVFKVIPGEKVRIRNVIISGNSRTLDRIIRRELYLGAGDMYSLTDLKDSKNSLGRLGFFDDTTIEEKRIDNNTMDLVVKVKEAPTGNIQVGGGYGSYGGIMLTLGVSDKNIWGSGIGMGVTIERSETTESASFNVSNSRLNDSDFSGNFSIHSTMQDYYDYIVNSKGVTLGTGHKFSRNISGYLSYTYSENAYEIIDDNSTYLNSQYLESYSKSSITASVKYDSTDDFYLPREGFSLSQSFEKAGLGGDVDFIKSRTNFGKYYGLEPLLGFDAIARYKARYYNLLGNGYLPLAEKFYMGGIGSVRGYESYSISSTIIDGGVEKNIGGKQTFSNTAEISFPLIPKAKMRIVTFLDWGFIGDDKITEYSRGGYGVGLEWFSPVGPIQLMFAQPLNEQEGDRTAVFEFTMGQRF